MAEEICKFDTDLYVGKKIRHYRRERGLSLSELEDLTGISAKQIQKFETGGNRINATAIHKIAVALGLGPESLFPPPRRSSHSTDDVEKIRRSAQIAIQNCTNINVLAAIMTLMGEGGAPP